MAESSNELAKSFRQTEQDKRNREFGLMAHLDSCIGNNGLAELHTHLLGMGSPEFWVDEIMMTFVPRSCAQIGNAIGPWSDGATTKSSFVRAMKAIVKDEIPKEVKPFYPEFYGAKSARDFLNLAIGNLNLVPGMGRKEAEIFILERFTNDVVYPAEILYQAFGLESIIRERRLYALESLLYNAAREEFGKFCRDYVIFNVRDSRFELHFGLPNTFFVNAMTSSSASDVAAAVDDSHTIKAAVYNCFAMLNRDGSLPQNPDLRSFRGNFTPEFYPMRYAMKDPLYHQRPRILGILLNTVLSRYNRAGVSYVEFSVGVGDLLRPVIWGNLRHSVFSSSSVTFGPKELLKIGSSEYTHDINDKQEAKRIRALESTRKNVEQKISKPSQLQSRRRHENVVSTEKPARTGIKRKAFSQDDQDQTSTWDYLAKGVPIQAPKEEKAKKSPSWREHTGAYNQKPTGICVRFLMAFARNRVVSVKTLDEVLMKRLEPTSGKQGKACTYESPSDVGLYRLIQAANGTSGKVEKVVCSVMERETLDSFLESLFPKIFTDGDLNVLTDVLDAKDEKNRFLLEMMKRFVVGVDLVGDELGFPYCPFIHSGFLKVIKRFRKHNERFGIRLHAGEGVPRSPSASGTKDDSLDQVFSVHMGIILETLKRFREEIPGIRLRIGHGIGFLRYEEGRQWLLDQAKTDNDKIVCELNITSNHVLLGDSSPGSTSESESLKNVPTLGWFLNYGLPVILGTDDDGIWPIHKCKAHYRHISLAHEYCKAIVTGQIEDIGQMKKMIGDTWGAVFGDYM